MPNITFSPDTKAISVKEPEIKVIFDEKNMSAFNAVKFIQNLTYEEAIILRNKIRRDLKRNKPRFTCPICSVPIYLIGNKKKRFFFRHTKEDNSCPAITRSKYSQDEIRAIRFKGQQESPAHIKLKDLIYRSLKADSNFKNTIKEKVWTGSDNPKSRRKPDVSTENNNYRLAFEAHISSTFLNVIVDRKEFYRNEGAVLIWIMANFDPNDRNMAVDDIIFTNNSNVLVVDTETTEISERYKEFLLRCFYRRHSDSKKSSDHWTSRLIKFNELKLDPEHQTAWYQLYEDIAMDNKKNFEDDLRRRFLDFWLSKDSNIEQNEFNLKLWNRYRKDFKKLGLDLPEHFENGTLKALLNCIISVQTGKPFGWRFKTLHEVAHLMENAIKHHTLSFLAAVKFFKQGKLINSQDKLQKWSAKVDKLRSKFKEGDIEYTPNTEYLDLVEFLFPGLGKEIIEGIRRFYPEKLL